MANSGLGSTEGEKHEAFWPYRLLADLHAEIELFQVRLALLLALAEDCYA